MAGAWPQQVELTLPGNLSSLSIVLGSTDVSAMLFSIYGAIISQLRSIVSAGFSGNCYLCCYLFIYMYLFTLYIFFYHLSTTILSAIDL